MVEDVYTITVDGSGSTGLKTASLSADTDLNKMQYISITTNTRITATVCQATFLIMTEWIFTGILEAYKNGEISDDKAKRQIRELLSEQNTSDSKPQSKVCADVNVA